MYWTDKTGSVADDPSIQALECDEDCLDQPNGRALIGRSHANERHSLSSLFAGLNVGTRRLLADATDAVAHRSSETL